MRYPFLILLLVFLSSCKTKSELRKEMELEKLRQENVQTRSDKVDIETMLDDFRVEMSKLSNSIEEASANQSRELESVRTDLAALKNRIVALEQHEALEDQQKASSVRPPPEPSSPYLQGKRYFDEGNYEAAIETLQNVAKQGKGEEARKSLFLMAEAYYSARDYATAAIEFGEYKKIYPKDSQVPLATYRQANAFKNLGKSKEARLFYQELLDRYPKHTLSTKARAELKKLKG